MQVKKNLGTVYDVGDSTVEIPVSAPVDGEYLVSILRPDGSNGQRVIQGTTGQNLVLPNAGTKKAFQYGLNVLTILKPDKSALIIDGAGRYELIFQENYIRKANDIVLSLANGQQKIILEFSDTLRFEVEIIGHHLETYPSYTLEVKKI